MNIESKPERENTQRCFPLIGMTSFVRMYLLREHEVGSTEGRISTAVVEVFVPLASAMATKGSPLVRRVKCFAKD